MMDFTTPPSTDPTPLYERRDAVYADDMLTAAFIELDFFTWLAGKGTTSLSDACREFELQTRGGDVMITLLKARRLLTEEAGTLRLTPLAGEFLVKDSPWSLRPYYEMLKDRPGVRDLLSVMRTGRPVFWGGKQDKKEDWHTAMLDPNYAQSFTAAMDCRGLYLAQGLSRALDLTGIGSVLDIAGGSGIYACSLAAHHPHLKAAVFELPPVDQVAQQLINDRGLGAKVSVLSGDMMRAPLPRGFGAHLWSNVLHDWDVAEVKKLLNASATAMASGGLIIIHDAFLNEAKDGPLHVAEYSVTLAYATQGRCYGVGEMAEWLSESGFGEAQYQPTTAGRGVMTARRL